VGEALNISITHSFFRLFKKDKKSTVLYIIFDQIIWLLNLATTRNKKLKTKHIVCKRRN